MQTYEGYFENGRFYTAGQTIRIPERKRISLTLLEETKPKLSNVKDNKTFWKEFDSMTETIKNEDLKLRADWLKRLNAAINLSSDEELPYIPRSQFMREPINLSDEG